MHFLHARHELINVLGWALLLSSQYVSRRLLGDKCCSNGDCNGPSSLAPAAFAVTSGTNSSDPR